MQKRNVAVCIVLSIFTCGIYMLYWYYTISKAFYEENTPNSGKLEPIITVVLYLVTCGIYPMYLYYKWGKATPEIYAKYGLQIEDKSILYLILGYFMDIIALGIIQNDFNNLIDATGGAYNPNMPNYDNNGAYNNYTEPYFNPNVTSNYGEPPAPGSPYDTNNETAEDNKPEETPEN